MSDKEKIFNIANSLNSVDKVYFINEVFGNVFGDDTQDNLINQAKNLYDELDELQEALDNSDTTEVVDAIGDLLTFAYGIGYFLGMGSTAVHGIVPIGEASDNQELHSNINADTKSFIESVRTNGENGDVSTTFTQLISSIKSLCVFNNIDEEVLMGRITISNLTKICTTYDDLLATVDKYENNGVDVYAKYFQIRGVWVFVVYSSKEQTVQGKVYRKNKFLKCIHFEEPVLSDLAISGVI